MNSYNVLNDWPVSSCFLFSGHINFPLLGALLKPSTNTASETCKAGEAASTAIWPKASVPRFPKDVGPLERALPLPHGGHACRSEVNN